MRPQSTKRRRVRLGVGLAIAGSLLATLAIRGFAMAGTARSVADEPVDSVRAASGTTRTIVAAGIDWRVDHQDGPGGHCIGVVAQVGGVEQGSVGGGCGQPDNPLLNWGVGGLLVADQWYNVAYGEVGEASSGSVRVTLGDGEVIIDQGVPQAGGLWIVVIPAEPTSLATDIAGITALDGMGSVVAQVEPPSLAAEVRLAAEQRGTTTGEATGRP